MTIRQKIIPTLHKALFMLRERSPYDTGNLKYNAIKLENVGRGKWLLYVDENIAPYMPYTNEPWVSPKWHGKKNPNEGWFDEEIEEIIKFIAAELGGKLTKVNGGEE